MSRRTRQRLARRQRVQRCAFWRLLALAWRSREGDTDA